MSGTIQNPSVTVIVPTLDAESTLARALASLRRQVYAGAVELLCIDGGSVDRTCEIALQFGATVIPNEAGDVEEARAVGVDEARGELLLLLDADDELPHDRWLEHLVRALALADDVVAADCLFYAWRRMDPAITRLCALTGGFDPLAVELGFGERWATHLNRWTGMPVEEEDRGEALLVRIDPADPPRLGWDGFLVRRDAVLATKYRPFVASDVVGDLAEEGWRFARVRDSIVHHYAIDLRGYAAKAKRRARHAALGIPFQRRGFEPPPSRTLRLALSSWLLVGPAVRAARGYRARPDPAWALYPVTYAMSSTAYVIEMLRAILLRGHIPTPVGRLGRGTQPRLRDYPGLVSVVMPSFNEGQHLAEHLDEALRTLDALGCRYELIVVDDGSVDDTRLVAEQASANDDHISVVGLSRNSGKGLAQIHGTRAAHGDLVLFVDADLEIHPRQLSFLYESMVREEADIVIGSKLHPRGRVGSSRTRRLLSIVYYALVRLLFGLPVSDTQTGLKLYKREVLDRVLPRLVVKRYAHDLEVLVNAHRLGYRIAEAPVRVTPKRDHQRLGMRDVRQIARDTLAIWYGTYVGHHYDRHAVPSGGSRRRSWDGNDPRTGAGAAHAEASERRSAKATARRWRTASRASGNQWRGRDSDAA